MMKATPLLRFVAAVTMLTSAFNVLAAQSATTRIVRATNAFLGTLDSAQRRRVMFPFDDAEQRKRWSNFPTGMVRRAGVNLRELSPTQRTAAMTMISTVLSDRGYEKVQQIMKADDVFKSQPGRGGRRPTEDFFGSDLYYISVLGTPSERTPWMLQYGGHHLALNITVVGDRDIITPALTGAQPSQYTLDGKVIRPMGAESDKALALLLALDDSQRAKAELNYQVADLVLGPGQDDKTILPEGLQGSQMNAKQRAMLLDIMHEWAGIVTDNAAAVRMAELEADLNQTYFAWSGPAGVPGTNITAYYRIQGPHVVIEFAPQRDDPSLHVHTIYRDPTNDYGRAATSPQK